MADCAFDDVAFDAVAFDVCVEAPVTGGGAGAARPFLIERFPIDDDDELIAWLALEEM